MSAAVAKSPAPSLGLRIHVTLPEKVSAKTLHRWVKGMRSEYKLSQTALVLLETLIDKCRVSDFEPGSLCGVWESPCRLAEAIGVSTRVLNNAENQLIKAGLIARTTTGKGRRFGQRGENDKIITLFGISLAPMVNGYEKILAKRQAQALAQKARTALRAEIGALRQAIRQASPAAMAQAEHVLPGGRTSCITSIERLEQIKADLEAVLVAISTPSGEQETADRSEDFTRPDTSSSNLLHNCRPARGLQSDVATAQAAVRVASEDFQLLVATQGGPSWPNIVRAAELSSRRLGIKPRQWGTACALLGREASALCVLIIDRNARLADDHPYRARSALGCWHGLTRHLAKGATNMRGLLMSVDDLPANASLPDGFGAQAASANPFAQAFHRLARGRREFSRQYHREDL
ncbi:hypothetical protein Y88_2283 [Novosphingobium nitrogenifigens DSM 19370]|uniref:Plasmid replication protein C N-terminal domain-containing protein n=1 Tax=Novosphingobium nitrogenifigens DSM 19370 TaxID=983920 RepID=F1Z662_9SPHN|nr:helix-turn-helix domain-containing protein [Novosphingobium nitrogenifigens]EGD59844.1 hypothetical protein Y88_2283 [Novosphingobium nitrogenifigens DSM 19370]